MPGLCRESARRPTTSPCFGRHCSFGFTLRILSGLVIAEARRGRWASQAASRQALSRAPQASGPPPPTSGRAASDNPGPQTTRSPTAQRLLSPLCSRAGPTALPRAWLPCSCSWGPTGRRGCWGHTQPHHSSALVNRLLGHRSTSVAVVALPGIRALRAKRTEPQRLKDRSRDFRVDSRHGTERRRRSQ